MIPGGHIGQYKVLRKLGAGGMGTVFVAEHVLLKRRAAIKTLLPSLSVHPEIVERFFTEARATSAISDPGIVQVYDFGYHVDGTAYIVLELLEGEALSDRLDRLGTLPIGDALRIARQVASSLAAAHDRNIIHRDLKPENIFLTVDAEAQGGERTKLLDFGICKLAVEDDDEAVITQTDTMLGTPVYMSPEQCRGASRADHRSDIYALGCVLFHMIAGRPPFECDGVGEFIAAHLREAPPALSDHVPGLPEPIDALVARCLAKSPDDRCQSMMELHAEIEQITSQIDCTSSEPMALAAPKTLLGSGFGARRRVITNLPPEDAAAGSGRQVRETAGGSGRHTTTGGVRWRRVGSVALALVLVGEIAALIASRIGDVAVADPAHTLVPIIDDQRRPAPVPADPLAAQPADPPAAPPAGRLAAPPADPLAGRLAESVAPAAPPSELDPAPDGAVLDDLDLADSIASTPPAAARSARTAKPDEDEADEAEPEEAEPAGEGRATTRSPTRTRPQVRKPPPPPPAPSMTQPPAPAPAPIEDLYDTR